MRDVQRLHARKGAEPTTIWASKMGIGEGIDPNTQNAIGHLPYRWLGHEGTHLLNPRRGPCLAKRNNVELHA